MFPCSSLPLRWPLRRRPLWRCCGNYRLSTGEILAALEEYGLTTIRWLFYLDNDPGLRAARHLSGRKGSSWEGGQRVPFLAHWPGKISAGTVSSEPAMNIDLIQR